MMGLRGSRFTIRDSLVALAGDAFRFRRVARLSNSSAILALAIRITDRVPVARRRRGCIERDIGVVLGSSP